MADSTGTPIDRLSIEIGASSTKAVNSINKLAESMRDLRHAMRFDTGDTAKKITKLASALQSLKDLNNVKLNKNLAGTIKDIGTALNGIDTNGISKLTKFGSAIQNLKGVRTAGYDKLPASILNVAAAVDSITDETIAKIHRLTMALGRLKGVDLSGLGAVLKAQNDAAKAQSKAAAKGGKTGGKATDSGTSQSSEGSTGENIKKQIEWTYSLRENIRLAAEAWIYGSNYLKKYKEGLAAVPPKIKLIASIMGGIVTTAAKIAGSVAKWAFNTAVSGVKKIFSWLKKIAQAAVEVAKKIPKMFADFTGLSKIGNIVKGFQNIIRSFGRIAFYRAIRSAIKYVTESFKEGAENAYWYAREFGNATRYIADAYDQMSSSNFKMSNQLGAAWATLIATIQPIIQKIIALVTRAAEVLTQFFALLGGKTTYLKAIDYNKQWADSAGGAAKAAKEWKNQLMGFDEINRLEEPSDGGGGGGGDVPDYGNMFEEAGLSDMLKQIKDLWNSGEFERLGQLMGKRLNDMVNAVKWADIGKKIGKNLNGVIVTAYSFMKTADFRGFGESIATLLNNAVEGINFNTLGRLTARLRTALWDVIYGAVINVDWKTWAEKISQYIIGALDELAEWLSSLKPAKIAKAIKDFFGNIEYGGIKDSFINVIKTAWTKAIELKDAIFDEETKTKIQAAISNFWDNLNWEEIRTTISEKLKSAWDYVHTKYDEWFPPEKREAVKEKVFNFFVNAISSVDWEGLFAVLKYNLQKAFFGEKWTNWDWKHFGNGHGAEVVLGIIEGSESKKKELEKEMEDIAQTTVDVTERMLNIGSPSRVFYGIGTNIVQGLMDGITSMWNKFTSSFQGLWNGLQRWWNNLTLSPIHIPHPHFEWTYKEATGLIAKAMEWAGLNPQIPELNISWYAKGGFPEDGLFMANHGELVGQFSNGRTAVANNEQITEGISHAVYEAFMTAFSQTGGSGDDREIRIYLDGREIAKSTTKYQKQMARAGGV